MKCTIQLLIAVIYVICAYNVSKKKKDDDYMIQKILIAIVIVTEMIIWIWW